MVKQNKLTLKDTYLGFREIGCGRFTAFFGGIIHWVKWGR